MVGPGVPDMGRQPQLVPQIQKLVDVDEPADDVVVTFAQNDLVHLGPLRAVSQVPLDSRTAPTHMVRELDDACRLRKAGIVDI